MAAVRTVYVVSDLHLGGEPEEGRRGFRICTHENDLATFISSLGGRQDHPSELVLNGDTFDFLAEKVSDKQPFWADFRGTEQAGLKCLNTIAEDRCPGVIQALRAHLEQGHRLVILPGNHDIELSLPAVRGRLRELVAPRGCDYEFVGNGEAYRVGDVVIEHGDRIDDMNFVDYNLLRRHCGHLSRGMAVQPENAFDPPAGSKLVATVINGIKTTYRFIDLLKPEKEAAFPVILALEPGRRGALRNIARAYREGKRRRKEQLKQYSSDISARPGSEPTPPAVDQTDELGDILQRTLGRRDFALSEPADESAGVADISALDKAKSFATLLFGSKKEGWDQRLYDLLDALRAFQSGDAFRRDRETEPGYEKAARDLAYGPLRHVVFGHTHMARQIAIPSGGFYFNSGTWADVLRLPPNILAMDKTYAPLAELEQFVRELVENDFSRFTTMFKPVFVRFRQDENGNSTEAALCDYDG
ncbi:MAG TPA: hypothetical protein VIY49_30020 [Bryobacteraceae bacterium]